MRVLLFHEHCHPTYDHLRVNSQELVSKRENGSDHSFKQIAVFTYNRKGHGAKTGIHCVQNLNALVVFLTPALVFSRTSE
jgi:hypothetical protein